MLSNAKYGEDDVIVAVIVPPSGSEAVSLVTVVPMARTSGMEAEGEASVKEGVTDATL